MANRPVFTSRQWVAAIGVALSLHLLLAWALSAFEPPILASPAGQGGGLAVDSLSLGGVDLPVLRDATASAPELAMAIPATPVEGILQPVAPPEARPMAEVLPVRPERPRTSKPTSKPKQKAPQSHKAHKPLPAANGSVADGDKGKAKQGRKDAGAGHQGGRDTGAHAGVDRDAAPQPGNPRPHYPRLARSRGQEGRVLIRVSVLGNGRVGSATVASSSGHGALDRAALQAVKRWRFRPALRAGKPIGANLTVPVVFRLEG